MKTTPMTAAGYIAQAAETLDSSPVTAERRAADEVILTQWRAVQRAESSNVTRAEDHRNTGRAVVQEAANLGAVIDDLANATGPLTAAQVEEFERVEAAVRSLHAALERSARAQRFSAATLVDPLGYLSGIQAKFPTTRR